MNRGLGLGVKFYLVCVVVLNRGVVPLVHGNAQCLVRLDAARHYSDTQNILLAVIPRVVAQEGRYGLSPCFKRGRS